MSYLTSKTAIQNKFTTPNTQETQEIQSPQNISNAKDDNTNDEVLDTRPLAIRLAESYQKREEERAEILKLRNTRKGLDIEEVEFLQNHKRSKVEKVQLEKSVDDQAYQSALNSQIIVKQLPSLLEAKNVYPVKSVENLKKVKETLVISKKKPNAQPLVSYDSLSDSD